MIKNLLFDLDGTLLPMDQEEFVKAYFGALCEKFCPVLNLTQEEMIKGIWKSTGAMIKNDGSTSNGEKFWQTFARICGKKVLDYIKDFDEFYDNEFLAVKGVCGYNPSAPETIKVLQRKGYNLVAATNPIFPAVATQQRLKWAGLSPADFTLVTTYENSGYCKPNTAYYQDIMEKLNLDPEETMMVGNDVNEDVLPTQALGIDSYIITDCLINSDDVDITNFKHSNFRDFLTYARMLPDVR